MLPLMKLFLQFNSFSNPSDTKYLMKGSHGVAGIEPRTTPQSGTHLTATATLLSSSVDRSAMPPGKKRFACFKQSFAFFASNQKLLLFDNSSIFLFLRHLQNKICQKASKTRKKDFSTSRLSQVIRHVTSSETWRHRCGCVTESTTKCWCVTSEARTCMTSHTSSIWLDKFFFSSFVKGKH